MEKELFVIKLNVEMPELFEIRDEDDAQYESKLIVYEITEDEIQETLFSHIHESFIKNSSKLLFKYVDSSDEYSSYGPCGGGMTSLIYVSLDEVTETSVKTLFTEIFQTCDYFSI